MEIFVKQYGGGGEERECRDKLRLRGILFSFITVVTYPMQVYTNNEKSSELICLGRLLAKRLVSLVKIFC